MLAEILRMRGVVTEIILPPSNTAVLTAADTYCPAVHSPKCYCTCRRT